MRPVLVLGLLLTLLVASRAEAGRGTGSLKYLPDDTTTVVVADVARARSSAVFRKLFELAREQHAALDTLASSQPVEKLVETIVIGGNASGNGVIVLEGRIDKLLAEAKKASTSSQTHAGVTYVIVADGEVAVLDKKLVFTSAGLMPATIERAKSKKARGPAAVRTIMAASQPSVAVFGGTVPDASTRKQLQSTLGGEPQWVAFSFAMAHKLSIDIRLKFADEATAQAAVQTLNNQLTPDRRGQLEGFVGKEFSESVTVDTQHSFARVAATLKPDELDKVVAVVKLLM
jgi:hypothetical protein